MKIREGCGEALPLLLLVIFVIRSRVLLFRDTINARTVSTEQLSEDTNDMKQRLLATCFQEILIHARTVQPAKFLQDLSVMRILMISTQSNGGEDGRRVLRENLLNEMLVLLLKNFKVAEQALVRWNRMLLQPSAV